MVIWLTGLSGSGKTTICREIWAMAKPQMPELVILDGDAIRELYGSDLDYSEPSRHRQIGRLRTLAKFLASQGQTVLVAALYSHPDLLAENRRILPGYFEVYVQASLELVAGRDSKGLYAGAAAGRIKDVVGVDIPWRAPDRADLVLDADAGHSPKEMALATLRCIDRFQSIVRENSL